MLFPGENGASGSSLHPFYPFLQCHSRIKLGFLPLVWPIILINHLGTWQLNELMKGAGGQWSTKLLWKNKTPEGLKGHSNSHAGGPWERRRISYRNFPVLRGTTDPLALKSLSGLIQWVTLEIQQRDSGKAKPQTQFSGCCSWSRSKGTKNCQRPRMQIVPSNYWL